MRNSVLSVNLTKEAFERLCEIRDYLSDEVDQFLTLSNVCSTLIMQVTLPEEFNETIA